MNTLNEALQFIAELATRILSLDPANLIIVGSVALGYVLRIVRFFPNRHIPSACLVFTLVMYPLISHTPGQPARKYAIDLILAIIFWLAGWMTHRILLRPIERKIFQNGLESDTVFLDKKDSTATQSPDEKTPPQV